MHSADYWIEQLRLAPHPEGGFFAEHYRSEESIPASALPDRYAGPRSFSTSIYFLLRKADHSRFHRLQSDEIWHFYAGTAVELYVIHPDGRLDHHVMGQDLAAGQVLQLVIPRGTWFAARVCTDAGYVLVGCTVAPGFEFEDFELPDASSLMADFPQHAELISSFA